MLEKLKASARDVVLAAVAAFTGALAVLFATPVGDVTLPVAKAALIAAGWAAIRAAVGAIAAKLA
jgi:hypothetical protein